MTDTTDREYEPIRDATDGRYYQVLDPDFPGYQTQVGGRVYIRATHHGLVVRGVLLDMAHGNIRTPTVYQVVAVTPGHDVEVTGGTAHQGTLYECQDTTLDFEFTLVVPAFRLLPAA